MIESRMLRRLLIGYWAATALGVAVEFALESSLPEELRAFLDAQFSQDWTLADSAVLAVIIICFWLLVSGSIRIWRMRAGGRARFTLGAVVGIASVPLLGPAVYSGWGAALYELSATLGGMLLAALWLPEWSTPKQEASKNNAQ